MIFADFNVIDCHNILNDGIWKSWLNEIPSRISNKGVVKPCQQFLARFDFSSVKKRYSSWWGLNGQDRLGHYFVIPCPKISIFANFCHFFINSFNLFYFYQFLSISVNFCLFLPILANSSQLLSIIFNFCNFLSIFVNYCHFLSFLVISCHFFAEC